MQTFSVVIFKENLDYIDMLGSRERITTDADAKRLAKADIGSLRDSFIRQGP